MRSSCLLIQATLLLLIVSLASAQTMAMLQGRVLDPSGAAVPGASVVVRNSATGFTSTTSSDGQGRYHVPGIPAGAYQVTAEAPGFRSERIDALTFEVGRTLVRDFQLTVDTRREAVVVSAELPLLDRATSVVGHVVTATTVQEIPLNGRHFIDLGSLAPGSVAPSQTGFSSPPIRGIGALAFNTAGNREEAVGYIVNGVSTTNMVYGQLNFAPPVASIQEFKIDNSTFSAEYGHVSGAIVNLVTRSGTDRFRGEAFEFFRHDALDARNFFEFTTPDPHPFERNQFGGSFGGPIVRSRTFFFAAYEGLRQRQGTDMNAVVLSDDQRAAATDPVVRRLIPLIPRANYSDTDGTPRFVGAANARIDQDTWTADVRHNAGTRDRLLVFFGRQQLDGVEPTQLGINIPGFGLRRAMSWTTVTVNETHMFSAGLLNEARLGRTAEDLAGFQANPLNPLDVGIVNGVDRPIGLPQMIVAGALNFGGPANLPLGRKDTLYVFNDTLTRIAGRHSFKTGGEFRRFLNNNFAQGTGQFNFPSMAAFLAGTANAFSITLGERRNHITEDALSFFAQDAIAVGPSLTIDLGLRYEWHMTPTERDNQFVVFDAATGSLVRVGVDVDKIYRENNDNIEPRLGFAWTIGGDGRTVRARRLRLGGRSTGHHRGERHGRQPAVCDTTHGDRIDSVERRRQSDAAHQRCAGHRRCAAPQRLAAVVECQRAAPARGRAGRDHRLLRIARQQPAHLAQSQSAREWRSPVSGAVGGEPDSSRHDPRQHHAGGEHGILQLSRALADRHQAAVAGIAVRHVVHVVEIARHQLAQLEWFQRTGRLRHPESIRPV